MRQSAIAARRSRGARLKAARSLLWVVPTSAAAVVLGLQQAGRFDPPTWLIWAALLVGPVAIAADVVVGVVKAGGGSGDALSAGDLQKFLSGCAIRIHEELGIPATSLGVSLWAVYRPRRTAGEWMRTLGREGARQTRYLYRIERFRVSDPPPIDVAWPEGRGVIGRCIATNEQTHRDHRPTQRSYPREKALTDTQWKTVRKKDQDDGFERHDFVRMIHRYEQVLAMPIADAAGRVIGCISVDVTCSDSEDRPCVHASLRNPKVIRTIHRTRELMTDTVLNYAVRP